MSTNDACFVTFETEADFIKAYKENPRFYPFPPMNLEPTPAPKNKKIFSEDPAAVKVEDASVNIDDVLDGLDGLDMSAVKPPSTDGITLDIDRKKENDEDIERIKRKYTKRQ
jgi:hypothetical protein